MRNFLHKPHALTIAPHKLTSYSGPWAGGGTLLAHAQGK